MSNIKQVDARNSFCPGPLMELIAAMNLLEIGDELEIMSTDKGSANDIPEWIKKVGHQLLECREEANVYYIRVRKTK